MAAYKHKLKLNKKELDDLRNILNHARLFYRNNDKDVYEDAAEHLLDKIEELDERSDSSGQNDSDSMISDDAKRIRELHRTAEGTNHEDRFDTGDAIRIGYTSKRAGTPQTIEGTIETIDGDKIIAENDEKTIYVQYGKVRSSRHDSGKTFNLGQVEQIEKIEED